MFMLYIKSCIFYMIILSSILTILTLLDIKPLGHTVRSELKQHPFAVGMAILLCIVCTSVLPLFRLVALKCWIMAFAELPPKD